MSEEQVPDVEDIKARLADEIPVEEEPMAYKAERGESDVVNQLQELGRQLGETLRTAWYSEERKRFEREVREGVDTFASEMNKAFQEVKESPAAARMKEEAAGFKTRAESTEIPGKTRASIGRGLGWLSEELANLAEQFTPIEKDTSEEEPTE
jgi:hypothetical protein